MAKQLNVIQLYPGKMNIYGDNGNALIICRRLKLYGFAPQLLAYNSMADRDKLVQADLVLGGGGQDSGQRAILDDLAKIGPDLVSLAQSQLPMLMICGLYQLWGHYFQTKDGDRLAGLGLFNMTTVASDKRLIGNAIIDTVEFGELVGYENHSGLTKLSGDQLPLGIVRQAYGNNGRSNQEGARQYAMVGTYLHGPILAKNPRLADWLISQASQRRYAQTNLSPATIRDERKLAKLAKLTTEARRIARSRPQ